MTVSLGLVGLGTIARNQHLPAIAATPGLRLAAIASRNAALDGLPAYLDVEEMLAAEVSLEAVTLCTPPQGRFAQAAAVLRAGRHLMLEKPPGASVSEVAALERLARAAGVTLFATWHSREAASVDRARELLRAHELRSVRIEWREDVRKWHPGQDWIWRAGGLGVLDPGINALSVLTRVLAEPVHPQAALMEVPVNCQAPIAARIALQTASGAPVTAELDWRQSGEDVWDIRIETDGPEITLSDGGARLIVDGVAQSAGEDREYRRLYARFAELVASGQSEVDLAPLQLVADIFMLAERQSVAAFHDPA